MSVNETHVIVLHKPAKNNLNPTTISANVNDVVNVVNNKSLAAQGWTLYPASPMFEKVDTPDGEKRYLFKAFVICEYAPRTEVPAKANMLAGIVRVMDTKAGNPANGSWGVGEVDGEDYEVSEDANVTGNASTELAYASVQIPPDFDDYFQHLYGLNPHFGIVRKSIELGIASQWSKRSHTALIGPPGCGKSDICQTIKRMFGEDAVFEFDGTSTTAAGAIKMLSEAEILPRIIVIEEIEKAPEASMQFLLGILDLRAEIRKTTARANIQREMKLLAIATVNDYALFQKLQAGALASRFMNHVFFKRPSRDTLARILGREIRSIPDGKESWVTPALDYCFDRPKGKQITDPRKAISICLVGGDDLLDGSYQAMLEATSPDADSAG